MSQVSLPGLLLGCPQTVFLPAGANGQVSYGGLSGGPFSIDPQTGLIVTTRVLDREEQEQHVLMGRAVLVREGCSRRGAGCSPLLGLAVLQGHRPWEVVGLMCHVGLVWHAGFSGVWACRIARGPVPGCPRACLGIRAWQPGLQLRSAGGCSALAVFLQSMRGTAACPPALPGQLCG